MTEEIGEHLVRAMYEMRLGARAMDSIDDRHAILDVQSSAMALMTSIDRALAPPPNEHEIFSDSDLKAYVLCANARQSLAYITEVERASYQQWLNRERGEK